jgi:hypothetical protein
LLFSRFLLQSRISQKSTRSRKERSAAFILRVVNFLDFFNFAVNFFLVQGINSLWISLQGLSLQGKVHPLTTVRFPEPDTVGAFGGLL